MPLPNRFGTNATTLYREHFGDAVPASFHYDDTRVDWNAQSWAVEMRDEGAFLLERRTCVLDGCVNATLNIRRFFNAAVIEWFFELENFAGYDSGIFSQHDAADLRFPIDPGTSPFFYDEDGSTAQLCDFFMHKTQMLPWTRRSLAPLGGRSSSGVMPYFNLSMEDHGYIMAVGWSGQWRAQVHRSGTVPGGVTGEGIVTFTAGMEDAYFRLHAGEKVVLPRMLMLRWEGTEQGGYNEYRRFSLEHIVPKIDGKPIQVPICIAENSRVPASRHLEILAESRKHHFEDEAEVYWVDAGWFGVTGEKPGGAWYVNVGINDWQPNPAIYPNGMADMEKVAQAAREAGLGFLLWYEFERCRTDAERVRAHPDWYLGQHGKEGDLLLDLGHPRALEWIANLLKDHIRRLDMKVLRIDFNISPLARWRYNDAEDRKGISELKYMEGLYWLWDELLREFPNLIIDNCASGGRRLDYEALRRSIPMFRTDYVCYGKLSEPTGSQIATYCLHHFLPVNASSLAACTPLDTYHFRSLVSSGVVVAPWAYNLIADATHTDWLHTMLAQTRRMREYMAGDFWPLTGCSYSEKDWMAYQMDLPEQDRGMVVAFRRAESMTPAMLFELSGMDGSADYHMEDIDTREVAVVTGKTLQSGWHFAIPEKRMCRVVFYEKIRT